MTAHPQASHSSDASEARAFRGNITVTEEGVNNQLTTPGLYKHFSNQVHY
jgi:hypothetical protein